ncbi:SRPBCC domain-containing protein [Marivirga sericea]|nr:SRPBCC domain-containing protein [Marivirga sericea]
MAKEIKTEILIKATPEKIWSILTNFSEYPNWNPFIKSVSGEVKAGNKITVKIEPPESKLMTFEPTILTFQANKELKWIGHLLFQGLFDGEHKFELIDNRNDTTTFKHSEKFKGILVGFLNLENTKKGFQSMNEKLKELAEE